MRIIRPLAPLIACSLLLYSALALAHRGHAVWTDITWAGDRFEIVHRMHLADAIAISRSQGILEPLDALRSRAAVALYVQQRFHIGGPKSAAVLTTIGAEIENDFLFVYQEWMTALPAAVPTFDNRILLDIEPDAQAFMKILGPGLDLEWVR